METATEGWKCLKDLEILEPESMMLKYSLAVVSRFKQAKERTHRLEKKSVAIVKPKKREAMCSVWTPLCTPIQQLYENPRKGKNVQKQRVYLNDDY